ncbi:hypothetical protein TPAU25S_00553 [Tsukamurella paurometabola]|nr:Uncharacterised protein [Tsukamurella paurometabola]
MTPDRIIAVPIDRSMPPVMITAVVPSASKPIVTEATRMPVRLLAVRKFGLAKEKKITITMRLTKARNCCICPRTQPRAILPPC